MSQTSLEITKQMERIRAKRTRRLTDLAEQTERLTDWREYVRAAPMPTLIASIAVGMFFTGNLLRRQKGPYLNAPLSSAQVDTSAAFSPAAFSTERTNRELNKRTLLGKAISFALPIVTTIVRQRIISTLTNSTLPHVPDKGIEKRTKNESI